MTINRYKILLVDDDPFLRDVLNEVLIDKGHLVETAEDGRQALEKFINEPTISLIITDINMPEMDGIQLIRELRSNTVDVPIIVLSGNKEIAVVIEALSCGADDYLLKDELIQDTIDITVRKTLEKQHLKKLNLQLIADLSVKTREAEETLSYLTAIINNIPDGLLAINNDGNITLINPALSEMFGLEGAGEIGRRIEEVCGGELAKVIEKRLDDKKEVITSDIELKNKRIVRAETAAISKRNVSCESGSEFIGSVVVIRDITIEREIEKMKNDFISTVSHELRTPLTSILGFASLIKKKLVDTIFPLLGNDAKIQKTATRIGDNIDIIVSESTRLTTLINDLLDLSKMEAGKTEWKRAPLSVTDLIERALSSTTSLYQQKGLKIARDIESGLPEITGDSNRLLQVMINLISNAVKFTEKGQITCSAKSMGDEITISVSDTGVGIASEDMENVFEKFRQVGNTLTEKPQGTGLGLSICRQIVEHHGGRIWVKSLPGKGSDFSFSLPLPCSQNSLQGEIRCP